MTQSLAIQPRLLVFALSAAAWFTLLVTSVASPHHHHSSAVLGSALTDWLVMVYAMMLPLMASSVTYLSTELPRYQLVRSIAACLLGYSTVWLVVGLGIYTAEFTIGRWFAIQFAQLTDPMPIATMAFLFAGAWSLTTHRRIALASCTAGRSLRITGWHAPYDALVFGCLKGWKCVSSCLHIMLALVVAGHGLLSMIIVTGILIVERACLPRQTPILAFTCLAFAFAHGILWAIGA